MEEEREEQDEVIEGQAEEVEELGKITPDAWRKAARKLKELKERLTDSIDDYFLKSEMEALRVRYNDKERTPELFNAIMSLEG